MRRRIRQHPAADTQADAPAPQANAPATLSLQIEQFSFFCGLVVLRGTVRDTARPIQRVVLQVAGLSLQTVLAADSGQFEIGELTPLAPDRFSTPVLAIHYTDGGTATLTDLGRRQRAAEPGHQLIGKFLQGLQAGPPGTLLEVGARARSGTARRALSPPGWEYLGLDVVDGPNVDVAGDAHDMARLFPPGSMGGIMSISVFEHLAMPWKVVLEMNRLLRPGGLVFISTHQTWPLHDMPCDFWRFSQTAWQSLFNPATGFRIIEAACAEPVLMVAKHWHPIAHFANQTGFGTSAVLVEKIGETSLSWDVAATVANYPA